MAYLNTPSKDSFWSNLGRSRVDSESAANTYIKNAVLRRTDDMDDAFSLPMSSSTMSLVSPSSNTPQQQDMFLKSKPSTKHATRDKYIEDAKFKSQQLLKDVSPTKSITR